MKSYRFLALLLSIVLMLSVFSSAAWALEDETAEAAQESTEASLEPDSELLPEPTVSELGPGYAVSAKAAVLLELNSNTVIYSYNADEKLYPASLTKIMTCMLALDYGKLDDIVTVSERALEGLHEDGSSAGLVPGEQMSLRNLLYCMMLSSANEACNVVAEYISGDVESFVELMNQKAAALGCKGTHFANPHGLHDENHYTTANDLCTIARKALENPTFRDISSTTTYTVPATNMSESRYLVTTNYLTSRETVSDYYYPKASGIKTGFTTPAGRCLISTASDGNLDFLSILLGAETELLDDGNVWYHSFSETAKLFDYGFDNFAYAEVMTNLQNLDQVEVKNASGNGMVVLKPTDSVDALLPKNYDKEKITSEYTLDNGTLEAPLDAGQIVGTVSVYYNGTLVGQTTVETLTAVERSEIKAAGDAAKEFFVKDWWLFLLAGILLLLIVAVLVIRSYINNAKKRAAARRRRPGASAQQRTSAQYGTQRSNYPARTGYSSTQRSGCPTRSGSTQRSSYGARPQQSSSRTGSRQTNIRKEK